MRPNSASMYSDPFYAKQVGEWLARAEPGDKARYERLFASLEAPSPERQNRKPPPAPTLRPLSAAGKLHGGLGVEEAEYVTLHQHWMG